MPGRDGERSAAGASIERRIRAAFTERLPYKAAALFFALVLWLVVTAEEPTEELVPVRLEAEYDSGRTLVSGRPAIRALVAGSARDLIKLYDTPPIVRRTITDDAPDSVAVELTTDDVYVPPDVDAVVRDVQPRSFVLVFDVTATRQLPVKNTVMVASDTAAGSVTIAASPVAKVEPESVAVTGPRRLIATLMSVSTMTQTVTVGDSGSFIVPLDTRSLAGIKVRPAEVRVLVTRQPGARGAERP